MTRPLGRKHISLFAFFRPPVKAEFKGVTERELIGEGARPVFGGPRATGPGPANESMP